MEKMETYCVEMNQAFPFKMWFFSRAANRKSSMGLENIMREKNPSCAMGRFLGDEEVDERNVAHTRHGAHFDVFWF